MASFIAMQPSDAGVVLFFYLGSSVFEVQINSDVFAGTEQLL